MFSTGNADASGYLVSCADRSGWTDRAPKVSELSATDAANLDKQRDLVARELTTRYTAKLTRTRGDLALLQKLLDDGAFKTTQTFELQSLGVVFGDVLALDAGLLRRRHR